MSISKYWICSECAREAGAVMDPDHVCTMREGICAHCKGERQIEKFLTPQIDFDWPENKNKDHFSKAMRD